MTGTEPFIAAGDAVPSIGAAALRMVLFLAVFAAIAVSWLVWQRRARRGPRRIEVVDRALLSRGVSVALLRVESQRMLVGISADGVRLIRTLDRGAPEAAELTADDSATQPANPAAAVFALVFDSVSRAGGRQ